MPESQAIWIEIVDFLLLTSLLASLIFFGTVCILLSECVLVAVLKHSFSRGKFKYVMFIVSDQMLLE